MAAHDTGSQASLLQVSSMSASGLTNYFNNTADILMPRDCAVAVQVECIADLPSTGRTARWEHSNPHCQQRCVRCTLQ